tara:strand:- start:31644 stop:32771 length:1128 start_codon:yes stop_codon:yes gene_type:complete
MNIAIIGSGITGSLASISLANSGCRIDLYERLSDEVLINRDRTYAITHSSRRILEKLNIWSKASSDFVSFQHLNVVDHELNDQVNFTINDLNNSDIKYSSIGWIARHDILMSLLLDIISNNNNINKIPTSVINNAKNYDLIVVADGQNSKTKKKLNIPSISFKYDQVCITFKVLLRGVQSDEAFEILTSEGPLAILPLGGDLFQIVCSQSISKASNTKKLSKSLFLDYLAAVLPYGIEPDTIVDEPKYFPINFLLNYTFNSGKYLFLGETAHTLHPVGGQGLNLCWRDVDSLSRIISIPRINKRNQIIPILYTLNRIIDVLIISIVTDTLVRFSRSNNSILNFPKSLIFLFLKNLRFLRRFTLNIMTNGFNNIIG